MSEAILILVVVTSYVCIVKIINEQHYALSSKAQIEAFWVMLIFGWIWFPFWLVYKFWEWLLVDLPEQIKEWGRKRK
jgi:nucleoside permease NupC